VRPDEGGGAAPVKNLDLSKEALQGFKDRVDAVLRDLADSPASKSRVADQQIDRSSFSAGNSPFAEADGLYTQYNRVHTELKTLSSTLSDQIEALAITVQWVKSGFGELDEDVRRRFWAIQERTQERAEDAAREKAKEAGADTPREDDTGAQT
jgi:alpha-L-fucosidase